MADSDAIAAQGDLNGLPAKVGRTVTALNRTTYFWAMPKPTIKSSTGRGCLIQSLPRKTFGRVLADALHFGMDFGNDG